MSSTAPISICSAAREPEIYGHATLSDVEKLCRTTAEQHGLAIEFRQSNHEGEIVDWIQEARAQKAAGLIINPAGYTTTSIAILDALFTMEAPVVEVHITNIHSARAISPAFLHFTGRACGDLRIWRRGYSLAINGLAAMIGAKD